MKKDSVEMKALVKTKAGPGNVEVMNVEEPRVGLGEVMVSVKASGICGTDVLLYDWTYRGRSPVKPPLILGHEGAGEVVEIGGGVKGVSVGDRVCLMAIKGCGECRYCKAGSANLCQEWMHLGVNRNGTHSELISVPSDMILALPDGISFEEGAFIEPISISVNTLEKIGPCAGHSVVIVGPGPLGLFHLQIVKASGASPAIVIGLRDDRERLKIADKLGADKVICSESREATIEKVMDLTEGLGADIVIECAGTPEAVAQAIDMARGNGKVVLVGFAEKAQINTLRIVRGEISLVGVDGSVWRHYERAIELLSAKKISAGPMITHKLPLERGVEGIELMRDKKAVKALLYSG